MKIKGYFVEYYLYLLLWIIIIIFLLFMWKDASFPVIWIPTIIVFYIIDVRLTFALAAYINESDEKLAKLLKLFAFSPSLGRFNYLIIESTTDNNVLLARRHMVLYWAFEFVGFIVIMIFMN